MEKYRSIPGIDKSFLGLPCIGFDKKDGSNVRAEYSPKRGWYKFGTRYQTIDETQPEFGRSIPLFKETLAEGLEKVFRNNKVYSKAESITVYCEFYGEDSLGCYHNFNKPFELSLIDVHVHKRGTVLPQDFVDHFGHLKIARPVYEGIFDEQLIQDVRNGKFPVKEGIVAKGVDPTRTCNPQHRLWMSKIKTKSWIEAIRKMSLEFAEFKQILTDNERDQNVT